jgi:hypothetical protein
LQPLDDAIAKAVKAGDRKLYRKLQAARDEIYYDWREDTTPGGNTVLRKVGPRNMRLNPYDAIQFKREIGNRIRWTQDPLDGSVNQALGAAYGKVKDATNRAVDGLAELNQRYANLVGAKSAIERRLLVQGRNAHWSLSDIALGASGHLPLAIARKVATTPAVRTRTARFLYNLPRRRVLQHPALVAAPATAAAASAEEERRRLAGQP